MRVFVRHGWVCILFAIGLLTAVGPAGAQLVANQENVGVEEHLGAQVPMDTVFLDEAGQAVTLGDLIDGPVILSLVYFACPSICGPLTGGLADLIDEMDKMPGEDYQIITISFNPAEGPEMAQAKKHNYLAALEKPLEPEAWRFLTGSQESIEAVTSAVGFRYAKVGQEFNHPGLIFVLTPEGKVSRYVRGLAFVASDVALALNTAAEGKVSESRVVEGRQGLFSFCFVYDPEKQTRVLSITRISGVAILGGVAILLGVLFLLGRKRSGGESMDQAVADGTSE